MPETPAETIEDETRPARPADTLHEHILSALARGREIYTGWRQRRLVGTQICVTGSCGKSTAVRLISHMLAGEGTLHVLTHPNNDKHLLRPHRRRRQPVDFVVQEVSGYAPGAIAPLARSLRVDIAVITSVGTDHETSYRPSRIGMTMLEGVAREKGGLAAAVHVGGTVCLSADDPHVAGMAGRCRGRVVTFGTAQDADFRAINIELDWPQRIRFDLVAKGSVYPVVANFASRIMLPSIVGALAAAHAAGVDLEVAISRLAGAQPTHSRCVAVPCLQP